MDIFSTSDGIPTLGKAGRNAKYRHTAKGRAARNASERRVRERQYRTRPFVAWDGEGMNTDDGRHVYTMLAHSRGGIIDDMRGLSTIECFEFCLSADTRDGINIIYGGNYDVNMMLRDVPRARLEILYNAGQCFYRDYIITWRPGKQFTLKHRDGRKFRLFDVLPFFQRTFVQACDEYLGTEWEYRDQIIDGKKRRGRFTANDHEETKDYNAAELRLLVRLASELRSRLDAVTLPETSSVEASDGIRLTRWDGPGAIATALFQKYGVKASISEGPDAVGIATRYAYAGGRFEIIRQGNSPQQCYQYDINSAYPAAMRNLPCLAHGEWIRRERPTSIVPFGLYRIRGNSLLGNDWTRPQPLWYRTHEGRVVFGTETHNWYWTPEAQLALEHGADIEEAWEWVPGCGHQPFEFVPILFDQRAALKKAGDGAHVGIKLGLNSLYGKLAQQVGWRTNDDGTIRKPPYHCLEWAGYVTSSCRAQLYRAAMTAIDDVIAFETDAIFSRVPLDLDTGTGLGQWEETVYKDMTYLMSGYYFATTLDGKEIEKSRGVNKGTVTRKDVIRALKNESVIAAEQTRFVTLGQALHQDFDKWTRWITAPRTLTTMISGKRIHAITNEHGGHRRDDGWMETWPNLMLPMRGGFSQPYDIEWLGDTSRAYNRREDEEQDYE